MDKVEPRMFSQISRWKIVGDFIIALSNSDDRIQDLGWLSLEKWRNKQIFGTPLPEDMERINKLYGEFNKIKTELSYNREKFWKELPFYLR